MRLAAYALTSANDCPERDPASFTLEAFVEQPANGSERGHEASSSGGEAEGDGSWLPLDERSGVEFQGRHARLQFDLAAGGAPAARRFRLRIARVADPGAANSVQLACWDMYEAAAGGEHCPR